MAEVVLRSELDRVGLAGRVEVDSAGTGDWHIGSPMDSRARAELALRGYDGSGHRARQFGPSWFGRYDLVAAMDSANLRDLRAMAPGREAADRIRLFRSFDPALAGQPDGPGEQDADRTLTRTSRILTAAPRPTTRWPSTSCSLPRAGLAAQLAELLPAQPASAG